MLELHALVPRPVGTGHPLYSRSSRSNRNAVSKVLALLSSPSLGRRSIGQAISGTRCSEEGKIFGVSEGHAESQWLRGRVVGGE